MRLSFREGLNRCVVLAFMALVGMSGCGAPTGAVSGKVMFKGAPLKGGNVTFIPVGDDKHPVSSIISEDGGYSIDKLPVGNVKITVETSSLKPPPRAVAAYSPPAGQNPSGYQPPDPGAGAKHYVPIPDDYSDKDKSGLTYTVKSGSQPYDILLK